MWHSGVLGGRRGERWMGRPMDNQWHRRTDGEEGEESRSVCACAHMRARVCVRTHARACACVCMCFGRGDGQAGRAGGS